MTHFFLFPVMLTDFLGLGPVIRKKQSLRVNVTKVNPTIPFFSALLLHLTRLSGVLWLRKLVSEMHVFL